MRQKDRLVFIIILLISFTWLSSLNVVHAENDKKTGLFEKISEEKIVGYAAEPGVGSGKGESVGYINIDIIQSEKIIGNLKVNGNELEREDLQGKKHYNFSIDMESRWPDQLDRTKPFNLIGHVFKKANDKKEQYAFTSGPVELQGSTESMENTAALTFDVKPTKNSSFLIDTDTGVAVADIEANLFPEGTAAIVERQTPIDVVFIFDTSASMELDMVCYNNSKKILDSKKREECRDVAKMSAAKNGAYKAIETFKTNAVAGDRFALVPFASSIGTVRNFNTNTNVEDVKSQLDTIKTSISNLTAKNGLEGGTNYFDALNKANQLFGSSTNPKYAIFLTDGQPETYDFHFNINITGEFSKWGVPKKVERCFLGLCWESTEIIWKWSTEKYPINGNVLVVKEGNQAVLWHNLEKYLVSDYANGDRDYAYAILAAKKLASKNAKLYSIGFGSDGDVDMDFLELLSGQTGSIAQPGTKSNISTIFENVTKTINNQSLRNINVKVNIKDPKFPGNVSLLDGAVIDEENPNYAVINFDDLKFEKGETPTPPGAKRFSLTFDKEGDYTFNDVVLTYTDLSNVTQTISGAPFTVNVSNNISYGIDFDADVYDIDVDSMVVPTKNLVGHIVASEGKEMPEDASWSWISDNPSIATVNNDGTVTPHGLGIATLTVKAIDESGSPIYDESGKEMEAKATIKVNSVINKISIIENSYLLDDIVGKNFKSVEYIKLEQSVPNNFKLSNDNEKFKEAILLETDTDTNILKIENGVISKVDEVAGFQLIIAKIKTPSNDPNKDYYKINPAAPVEDRADTTLIKVNSTKENTLDNPTKEW